MTRIPPSLLVLAVSLCALTRIRADTPGGDVEKYEKVDHVKDGWTTLDYPHPRDPVACGRSWAARATAICDPDRLLHREAADRVEEVIDAARQESRIFCDATKRNHDVQIGVALLNKMDVPGLCDSTTRSGCALAAERFAKDIHDKWGVGDPGCGNSVLLFLSKGDRQMYIVTGKSAAKRMASSDIDKVFQGMKTRLRQNQFDLAVERGVLDIANRVAREKTWFDRVKPYIVPIVTVGAFIGFASWNNRRTAQISAAMSTLSRIEQEAACAAERRRGGGVVGQRWQCPVCLEDYLLDAVSAASVHVAVASQQRNLWHMVRVAFNSAKHRIMQLQGARPPQVDKKEEEMSTAVALVQGDKKSVLLRCGHRFCEECIAPWIGSGGSCPVCRTPHSPRQVAGGSAAAGPEGAASSTALSADQSALTRLEQMEYDMNPATWHANDLMFRLGSLQRRYPAIVSRALVDRWQQNRVVDFRTLEKDLQTSYDRFARRNNAYAQSRGTGSRGSSYSGFGGGSHDGGGGKGSSW